MKYAFVTCVELGLGCMEEIYACGGALNLAITLPDDVAKTKSGRVYLDSFCAQYRIPLLKAPSINGECVVHALREREIDWLFIIGWSQIAKSEVLRVALRGVLGMHPTLLPAGRGRAAIPWAILLGLRQTGVTLFRIDSGVDTGDIADQESIPIADCETAATLYERVVAAHKVLIRRNWRRLESGTLTLRPQDENLATVWSARRPEDGEITSDMSRLTADRLVRATTHPYPGAFYQDGAVRYRIWSGQALGTPPPPSEGSFPVIALKDGCLIPTDWEREYPSHNVIDPSS
jgi:methionyl-tRNA formyltransferase